MAVVGVVTEPEVVLAPGDRARIRIRAMASGGAGVGDLPDGRVVFVQRTAPGDLVDVRVRRLHRKYGEGDVEAVIEEGPGRVVPACPRYDLCGGCTLQHLAYPEQLDWKRRFVADAMSRIGKQAVDVPEVVPSPRPTHYRNRVTFTVRRLSGGGRVIAGFHALANPDRVVDIRDECLLPEPPILEAWGALRAAWKKGIRPFPSARELRVTLRALPAGVVMVLRGGPPGWNPSLLLAHVPGLVGVWHQPARGATAVRVAGNVTMEEWGGELFPVGGHAFLQVNREMAEAVVAHVLGQVGSGATAVDAYCGVGVYGRALARDGWRVIGIEVDPEACQGARHGAPDGLRIVEGSAEERLTASLPADLVIVNPPRAGLHPSIPGTLAGTPPGTLIYVSCDPATLARDTQRLSGAFHLESLRSFDLFPQTSHVETVAVFRRNRDVA